MSLDTHGTEQNVANSEEKSTGIANETVGCGTPMPASGGGISDPQLDFFDLILPTTGKRCMGILRDKKFWHQFFDTNEELSDAARAADAKGENVYFGCSSFKNGSNRTQENVAAAKSFWLDIDVGPGKGYASKGDAILAVKVFCKELGIPIPLIVSSGEGIHCYWPMHGDIAPHAWKLTAELLKKATKKLKLGVDQSRTADSASVLRPVGTHNRKKAPREVKVLHRGGIGDHPHFHLKLEKYVGEAAVLETGLDIEGAVDSRLAADNADLSTPPREFPPSDANKIADECAVVREMRDTGGNVPEPHWFDAIGVLVRTTQGEAVCHEWSAKHPRYSHKETQSKIDRALKLTGPTTCKKLSDHLPGACEACPYWGSITSPIELGEAPDAPRTVSSGNAEFECIDDGGTQEGPSAKKQPEPFDPSKYTTDGVWGHIPHREWLVWPFLVEEYYSMLMSEGAVGKTYTAIALALSVVTNRNLIGLPVMDAAKVVFINGEDGSDELNRRFRAACIHFKISRADIADKLTIISAGKENIKFNKMVVGGAAIDPTGFDKLEEIIIKTGAKLVIIDPLMNFTPAGTNDGPSASACGGRLTELCVKHKCSILLVHHVSKAASRGGDTNTSSALGSVMWANHARACMYLGGVSETDALALGIPASDVEHVRVLSNNKPNLAVRAKDTLLRLHSVELPNAAPPKYPAGDSVAVMDTMMSKPFLSLFKPTTIKAVLDKIAEGVSPGVPYKATGRDGAQDYKSDIAGILGADLPDTKQGTIVKTAVQVVTQLIFERKLVVGKVTMPRATNSATKGGGKQITGMMVNWDTTEWSATPGTGPFVGTWSPPVEGEEDE